MVRPITILMADDDPDDQQLSREALIESRIHNTLYTVDDGEELLEFLQRSGRYAAAETPRPGVILLDLNMPRMDGRAALAAIKNDPELRQIPVVILTTSKAEEDIFRSYDLGANSFISKPVTFQGLVAVMRNLGSYWLEIVELPKGQ
jgi:two-component system, response regulator